MGKLKSKVGKTKVRTKGCSAKTIKPSSDYATPEEQEEQLEDGDEGDWKLFSRGGDAALSNEDLGLCPHGARDDEGCEEIGCNGY